MPSKKKPNESGWGGLVYSTDPNFMPPKNEGDFVVENIPMEQQRLRVRLETKHRGGKIASVITGFLGTEEKLNELGKQLKNHCGTGGSAKDNDIIIQGDHIEKIIKFLQSKGCKDCKRG